MKWRKSRGTESGEVVPAEPSAGDCSRWEAWTDQDGTRFARLTVTRQAMVSMDARQRADLEYGWTAIERALRRGPTADEIERAFTPDGPIEYER